jgi:hypothetical protein
VWEEVVLDRLLKTLKERKAKAAVIPLPTLAEQEAISDRDLLEVLDEVLAERKAAALKKANRLN